MDNDSWNRVMMWISVIWLIVILFRLVFYTSYLSGSESGRIFSTVLNIILIFCFRFFVIRRNCFRLNRFCRSLYCSLFLNLLDFILADNFCLSIVHKRSNHNEIFIWFHQ